MMMSWPRHPCQNLPGKLTLLEIFSQWSRPGTEDNSFVVAESPWGSGCVEGQDGRVGNFQSSIITINNLHVGSMVILEEI